MDDDELKDQDQQQEGGEQDQDQQPSFQRPNIGRGGGAAATAPEEEAAGQTGGAAAGAQGEVAQAGAGASTAQVAGGEAAAGSGATGATAGAGTAGVVGEGAGVTAGAAAGETAGAVVAGAEAATTTVATTSSLGPWAVAGVLIVIVIMTFMIVFLQGGQTVNAGTPTTPPVIEPPPIYGCGDDLDGILQSHNIAVVNVQTCERKAVIVNAIMKLLSYPDFATDFGSGNLTITNTSDPTATCNGSTVWIGCTGSGSGFRIRDINGNKYSDSYWDYGITHEMFHVVGSRTNRKYTNDYDYQSYHEDEPDCYSESKGGVFKTYQLSTTDKSESVAESGAVYVTGRGGTGSFSDFETKCSNNYEFWNQEIGDPQYLVGGDTGAERTGPLVTFYAGNHSVTTHKSSASDCAGKQYGDKTIDLSNANRFPIGNFGDPNCDFTKEAALALVKQLDPGTFIAKNGRVYQRYQVWDWVMSHESGYFPNALNNNSHSGWGAWGMFQMNPDFSNRAVHDNGTTDWKTQIANAITRNNNVHGSCIQGTGCFGYWSTARKFRQGIGEPRIP